MHVAVLNWVLSGGLLVGTALRGRHFRAAGEKQLDAEAGGEVRPLYLSRITRTLLRRESVTSPTVAMSIGQTAIGLGVILVGSRVFVSGATHIASDLNVSHLAFALLAAPVATELPEAFYSSDLGAPRERTRWR